MAEEGSFRGAADRLGYVQSAVSQQIAFLERLVGSRLLERSRGPGPVSVTEAGRVLLGHADGILSRLHAARADLAALDAGSVGEVRVGLDPIVGRRVLPGVLVEIARERPGVRIVPVEADRDEQRLEMLKHGDLDLAFVDVPLGGGPLEGCELFRDPMVLLVEARSPLAQLGRPPTRPEIADLRLIAAPEPRVGGEISPPTVQALVGAGQGAAIVPRLAVDRDDEATVTVELDGLFEPRVFGLCWHRDRRLGEAVRAFRDAILRCCPGCSSALYPRTQTESDQADQHGAEQPEGDLQHVALGG